jgi:Spy/CpxP family protein refolding chaperone
VEAAASAANRTHRTVRRRRHITFIAGGLAMRTRVMLGLAALLALSSAPAVADPSLPRPFPVTHEALGRAFEDLAGQIHGLGDRLRGHFGAGEAPRERPLVTIILSHRQELGLSSAQVQGLERIRDDFQREAIKLDADQRVAQMDLAALLRADPVDLAKVEAKVREIERLRSDLRIGRIRAVERGKAILTPEQRTKLQALAPDPAVPRTRAGDPPSPPRPHQI